MSVKTRAARKRRIARARRHLVVTRAKQRERELLEAKAGETTRQQEPPKPRKERRVATEDIGRPGNRPERHACPVCGTSQKVRADGTVGKHDTGKGKDKTECPGTGQQWDAPAA